GKDRLGVNLRYRIARGGSHRIRVEAKFTRAQIQGHPAESLYQQKVVKGTEKPGFGDQGIGNRADRGRVFNNSAGCVDVGKSRSPQYVGPAAGGSDFPLPGQVHDFEVLVGALRVGGFVGTGQAGIVVVGLAVNVAQMRIKGCNSSVNALFGREKPGLVNAAWFFIQYVVAANKEQGQDNCSQESVFISPFHLIRSKCQLKCQVDSKQEIPGGRRIGTQRKQAALVGGSYRRVFVSVGIGLGVQPGFAMEGRKQNKGILYRKIKPALVNPGVPEPFAVAEIIAKG